MTQTDHTFHGRKAARTKHYEEQIKGWRASICGACNGSGYYDHNGSPYCGNCNGTGKEYTKPKCITDIQPLRNQVLGMDPSSSVGLRIFIRNNRELYYRYIGLDDGTKDPRCRAKLHFGYDRIEGVEDWYFEDAVGMKYYLHQFEPVTTSP